VALAVALLLAAFIAAQAVQQARRSGDEISVTGSARVGVVSDRASLSVVVSDTQNTAQAAYAAVQRGDTALGEILRGGVQIEPVTYTVTDDAGRSVERGAFKISRRFTVQSADLNRVQALAQNVGTLIQQGVPVSADPVQSLYTRLADVRLKLLADATKDARERAQAIAEASGMGAVRSARMGVFQITPRNTVQTDDYGSFDTASREKDVTAVVGVTFAVR